MVNEWTSNDVPSVSSLDLYNKRPDLDLGGMLFGAAVALEAVVEHLNSVHPKPRPVTRQDLPDDPDDRWETFRSRFKEFDGYRSEAHQHSLWTVFRSGIQYAETRMLDHLNANGGVPASREDAALADRLERQAATIGELQGSFLRVERDADRWRRAHSIVEQERDQAREQWKKWEHKANEAEREVSTWRTSTESAHSDFLQAAHDRDEAVARAEAAEARTAPAVTRDEIEIKTCNQCGRDANAPSGLSASSVYYHRYGIAGNSHTPGDAGDFGRCVDYLGDTRPVWMSDVSPEWGRLVCHWGELLDLYRDRSTRQEVTHRIRVLNMAPDEQPARHVLGQEAGDE